MHVLKKFLVDRQCQRIFKKSGLKQTEEFLTKLIDFIRDFFDDPSQCEKLKSARRTRRHVRKIMEYIEKEIKLDGGICEGSEKLIINNSKRWLEHEIKKHL
jgi:hypothetical protein